jgi:hypothetical protein
MIDWSAGETVLNEISSISQVHIDQPDDEKVIPWSEGKGLWAILNRLVSDLNGVDVITFFVQNPYAFDSAEGLSVRIGRAPERIEPVLERLVEAGFLRTGDLDGMRIYQMTDDPHHRQTLQQYVTWLREGFHWARMVMDRDG